MPPEGRTPYRPFLRLRLSSKMPYHPTFGLVICNGSHCGHLSPLVRGVRGKDGICET